jgi:hypothetical protein
MTVWNWGPRHVETITAQPEHHTVPKDRLAVAMAERFMRECQSPYVEAAIRDGWSRSLQHLIASHIRAEFAKPRTPTMDELAKHRLPGGLIAHLERHGLSLSTAELWEITAARKRMRKLGQ